MMVACSNPVHGANELDPAEQNLQIADEEYLAELRGEFLETSGRDYIDFERGVAILSPSAKFRLERQALWLRAYPMVSVRLVASGDGAERVNDRRLALKRASAVQRYLVKVGIPEHRFAGVEISPSQSGSRQRVITRLDPIQPVPNQ